MKRGLLLLALVACHSTSTELTDAGITITPAARAVGLRPAVVPVNVDGAVLPPHPMSGMLRGEPCNALARFHRVPCVLPDAGTETWQR